MTAWKVFAGVGVACAACCAVPFMSVAAVWGAGSAALAALTALGTTLAACANEFVMVLVGGLLAVAIGTGLRRWWRRRNAPIACTLQAGDGGAPRGASPTCHCAPEACR